MVLDLTGTYNIVLLIFLKNTPLTLVITNV